MLLSHIDHPSTYQPLAGSDIWQQALDWIKTYAHDAKEGIYELRGQDMFVNVHGYDTLPEDQCRFESHRQYIDLQYCIRGGERIAWQLTSELITDGGYNPDKDFQYHKTTTATTILTLTPGCFAVFYPEDGHRPKQYDGVNQRVWKLVVKIREECCPRIFTNRHE